MGIESALNKPNYRLPYVAMDEAASVLRSTRLSAPSDYSVERTFSCSCEDKPYGGGEWVPCSINPGTCGSDVPTCETTCGGD